MRVCCSMLRFWCCYLSSVYFHVYTSDHIMQTKTQQMFITLSKTRKTCLRFLRQRTNLCVLCPVYTTDTDKTRMSCLVGGVNRIGDKSKLFSVVLTAFRDWTKQFWNFLSLTVLTCCQFCSHLGQDKTVLSRLCWWCELGIRRKYVVSLETW